MTAINLSHAYGSFHKFSLLFHTESNHDSAKRDGRGEAREIFKAFYERLPGETFDNLIEIFNEFQKGSTPDLVPPFRWMRQPKSWEMY